MTPPDPRRTAAAAAPAGLAQPADRPADDGRLHGLPPVAAAGARLLVLGSFPGVASLRAGRYYAHPRNQFWTVVGALLEPEGWASMSPEARCATAAARGLALWDVYASCRREGSLDSAIREPELNDLPGLVRRLPALRGIAHNGGESARVHRITAALGLPVWRLPSTSPANASWSLARKCAAWREAFVACGLVAGAAPEASCATADRP